MKKSKYICLGDLINNIPLLALTCKLEQMNVRILSHVFYGRTKIPLFEISLNDSSAILTIRSCASLIALKVHLIPSLYLLNLTMLFAKLAFL